MRKSRKIAVVGAPAVGKSALIQRFINNTFDESYQPTIESTHQKILRIGNQEYDISVIDTAGQDEYSMGNYCIGTDGYIFVYSITSSASLDLLKTIREKLVSLIGIEGISLIVVGMKSDLYNQRQVSTEDGKFLANSWNCPFAEVSAKSISNPQIFGIKNSMILDQIFASIITQIERHLNPVIESNKGCVIS